eukprot:2120579-Rhodomonas_salina.7
MSDGSGWLQVVAFDSVDDESLGEKKIWIDPPNPDVRALRNAMSDPCSSNVRADNTQPAQRQQQDERKCVCVGRESG